MTGRRYDFALPWRRIRLSLTMIVNNGGLIRSSDAKHA